MRTGSRLLGIVFCPATHARKGKHWIGSCWRSWTHTKYIRNCFRARHTSTLKPLEQPKLLIEMEEVRRTREAKEAKKQDARHKEPPQRKKKEKRNKPDEVEDKVEILSENHTEWEDIIGNGQLLKKVLRKGEHMNRPTSGDVCVLNIEGRLASNSKVIQKYKNLEVIAGEGDLIQGLDLILMLMDVGELSRIKTHSRFAYGDLGLGKDIPPKASLVYTVELVSAEFLDMTKVNLAERRKWAYKKRERGNWWYERNEPYYALDCYQRSLAYIAVPSAPGEHPPETEVEMEDLAALEIIVRNNMAAAQIKLGSYENALQNVDYILAREPTNTKAMYRKATIMVETRRYAEAYDIYLEVRKLQPDMKNLSQDIRLLSDKISRNAEKEKNFCRKMFGLEVELSANGIKNAEDGKEKEEQEEEEQKEKTKGGDFEIRKKLLWGAVGGVTTIIFSALVQKFLVE